MARVKLTLARIRAAELPAGKKQHFLWDVDAPQLAVRVTAGAKAFVFQSLFAGKTLRLTIGDCNDWQLEAARNEARRLQTLIDSGTDPRQEKADRLQAIADARAEAQRAQLTLGDVWSTYVAEASQTGRRKSAKPWGARHLADHAAMVRRGEDGQTAGPLASLLDVPLAKLDAKRLQQWLRTENATRPTQTALAFRLLRTCINWLATHPDYAGLIDAEVMTVRAVTQSVAAQKPRIDDTLRQAQLGAWFAAVRSIPNLTISAYLQTVLLTGRRREEILNLQWADVDFKWRTICINDKVQGTVTLPLPPYCAALLASLPRRNEWVFSSPAAANGRLQEPRIAHNQALGRSGLPQITIHGLRRTYANATQDELPAGVAAQLQGHVAQDVRGRHYLNRPLDVLARWSTEAERVILAAAGIEQPSGEYATNAKLRLVDAS